MLIEHESPDDKEWEYWIGRIEKVLKTKVLFLHFDADGIWQDEPYEIPFSRITSVTFDSRYVTVFSKYVQFIKSLYFFIQPIENRYFAYPRTRIC